MGWGKNKDAELEELRNMYESGRRLYLLTKHEGWDKDFKPIMESIKLGSEDKLHWAPNSDYTDAGKVALERAYHSAIIQTVEAIVKNINAKISAGEKAGEDLNMSAED